MYYEYPVVLLEEVFRKVGSMYYEFRKLTDKYIFTNCRMSKTD